MVVWEMVPKGPRVTWRFMGSYKWDCKSPSMSYNYSYPTCNRPLGHGSELVECLQGSGTLKDLSTFCLAAASGCPILI